jgi:glyoxylase-like metal-dependent hydrolase (beta-lactamase superfamily II)
MPRDELAHRIRARHAAVAERWQARRPPALQLTREVVPGVFQVRTRGSRTYLIVDDGVTVIDSGGPGQGERVLAALREVGRSADDVRHVLLTHAHIDHVGGLPELQRHVPARTAIHLAEAPLVTAAEP